MAEAALAGDWRTGTSGSETSLTDFTTKTKSVQFSRNGEILDVTALGDTTHKYIKGLLDADLSVEYYFDATIWAQLHAKLTGTTALSFQYGPKGSTSGYPKVSGTSMLQMESLEENTEAGQLKTMTAKYKVSGAPTFGTY